MIVAMIQRPPPIHGAALRNEEFLKFLQGHDEVVAIDLAPKQSIGTIGAFSLGKVSAGLGVFWKLLLVLLGRTRQIQVVYITPAQGGWGLLRDSMLIVLATLFRRRVVAHFRAIGLHRVLGFKRTLLRFAMTRVHAVAMSKRVSQDLSGVVDDSRLHIVSNGLRDYSPSRRASRSDSELRVLHVSNLSAEKGAFDALEAFLLLLDRVADARLTIVGSWVDKDEEARFAKRLEDSGAGAAVRLPGPLYGEAKWREFIASDLFLFPSTYSKECFPGVVLEAMSAGLPVVSYAHAAVPDILDHGATGWVVECGDVQGLANGMSSLASDSTYLATMSDAAFGKFNANFKASVTHPRLLDVLRGCP